MKYVYERRYRSVRRVVSVFLMLALVVTLIPVQSEPVLATEETSVSEPKEKELIEERTEDSKVIDNGDGTFTKEVYFEPIHTKEGSKWEEISTELVKKEDEIKPENTSIDVTFAAEIENGEYARVVSGDHHLSYSFIGADGEEIVDEKEESKEGDKEENQDKQSNPAESRSDKTSQVESQKEAERSALEIEDAKASYDENEVTYENVLPNVALRNKVFNTKIKEDIILQKETGLDTFYFSLDTDLSAEKKKDGTVTFEDKEGNVVFTLTKPYMYDSNIDPKSDEPAQSDQVDYVLTKEEGKLILAIKADREWLSDPKRKYPIYVDPSTTKSTAGDTYVSSKYTTTNYGSSDQLKVGYYDGTTGRNHSYLKQDVSGLKGMIIESATLNVHVFHSYFFAPTKTGLWLDEVKGDWTESGLTWKVQQDKKITSTNIGMKNVARGDKVSFNVTQTVQAWVSGTRKNNGFKFHTNGNDQEYWKKIISSEGSGSKPYLSIKYQSPQPGKPKGLAYSNWEGSGSGFIDLKWDPVQYATGYYLWIFNGKEYQKIDVGNTTHFTTNNKKIWPTEEEIKAGRYQLHMDANGKLDGKGADLAKDPTPVYKNSGGTYKDYYYFRVSAKTPAGESERSDYLKILIPNRIADLGTEEFWAFGEIPGGDINAVTGNMIITEVDLELPGRELDMEVIRTYNSHASKVGIFGRGWSFNYEMSLQADEKGNALLNDMDGGKHYFQQKDDGSYARPLGVHLKLEGSQKDGWTLTDKDQTIYSFSSEGKLTSIEDMNNNRLSLTYNDKKQLTKLTDPSGRSFHLTYEGEQVSKVTGPEGRDWVYTYNDKRDLISVTDETGSKTQYGYFANGTMGIVIDPDGGKTWYTYNIFKQLTEIIDPEEAYTDIEYNPEEGKTIVYDANTNTTEYYYNDAGNLIKEVEDPFGLNLITTYKYDRNNLIEVCDPEANREGCNEPTESYQYDAEGNLTRAEDAAGGESFKYDKDNNLVEYQDAEGDTFEYIYDDKGNEVAEIDPDQVSEAQVLDDKGNIVEATDEMGTSENLILNPGLERVDLGEPDGWHTIRSQDDGLVTVDVGEKKSGRYSLRLTPKTDTDSFGYLASTQELDVVPGKEYMLSANLKAKSLNGANAFLNVVQLNDQGETISGTWQDTRADEINGTTEWTKHTLSVKSHADAKKIRVYLEVDHRSKEASGSVWFDEVTFQTDESFKVPLNWVPAVSQDGGAIDLDNEVMYEGNPSIRVDSKARNDFFGYIAGVQERPVQPSSQYTLSAMVKTKEISEANAFLHIVQVNKDGEELLGSRLDTRLKPAQGTSEWSKREITIPTRADAAKVKIYLQVDHTNEKGSGTAWFSDVQLKHDPSLLKNSGFEGGLVPTNWVAKTYYDDGFAEMDAVTKYSGNHALKVVTRSTSEKLGYAGATQELYVAPNTTYTFSAMIKTKDLIKANAFLNVKQMTSTGKTASAGWSDNRYSELSGTQDWTRRQFTFHTGPDTEKILMYLEVDHTDSAGNGMAWFDEIQLEEGDYSTSYNPIENSSFEDGLGNWIRSAGTGKIDSTVSFEGSQSLKMERKSTTDGSVQYLQYIPLNQKEATPITVTGLSRAVNVVNKEANEANKDYSIYVDAIQDEGNGKTSYNTDQAKFALGSHGWQRAAVTITPDKPLKEVRVYVLFRGKNTGTVWFDNIRVKEGSAIEKYEYDQTGNYITKVTDPTGETESIQYDAFGNETAITDARGLKTEYTYDDSNQLKTVTLPDKKLKVVYSHDENGNVIEKKVMSGDENTLYNKVTYTYENDLLVATTDELGRTTRYQHDGEGDVTSTTHPNGKTVTHIAGEEGSSLDVAYDGEERYRIHYDVNGNEVKIEDLALQIAKENTFDESDRLTQITQGKGSIGWEYNDSDELIKTRFAHGDQQAVTQYGYNESEQNTEIKDGKGNVYRFDYDETGNVRTAIYPNGVGLSASYDDNINVTEVAIGKSNGDAIAQYQYEYDANGNTTRIQEEVAGLDLPYTYDGLDQLISEMDPATGNTISYAYDPVGNRTEKVVKDKDGQVVSHVKYNHNTGNQLIQVDDIDYKYDENGNRIEDGQYLYSWDAGNRLVEVKEKKTDKRVATYDYDEDGRRVRSTINGEVTNYHYDGAGIEVLYETDASDELTRYYTYSEEGQLLSMTKRSGKTYFYQVNAHGDVIAITDEEEKIVASYTYDAWGNIVSQWGEMASENPFRYAGYRYDNETGMYYLMARYYQPEEGVFLSADPDPGDEDDPQSQNVYLYANNNPIKYIDPDGHWLNVAIGVVSGAYKGYKTYKKTGSLKKAAWAGSKQALMDAIPVGRIFKAGKYLYKGGKKAYKYAKKYNKRVKKKPSKKKVKKYSSTKKVKKSSQRRYSSGKKYKSKTKSRVKRKYSRKQSKYSGKRTSRSTKYSNSRGSRKMKKGEKRAYNKQVMNRKAPKADRTKRELERKRRIERILECQAEMNAISAKTQSVSVRSAGRKDCDKDEDQDDLDEEEFDTLEELLELDDDDVHELPRAYKDGKNDEWYQSMSDYVVELRSELGSNHYRDGNIAILSGEINGTPIEMKAHSKKKADRARGWEIDYKQYPDKKTHFQVRECKKKTGTCKEAGSRSEDERDEYEDRGRDSEVKIFERLARDLNMEVGKRDETVKGTLKIFTERKPCDSCNFVMTQFKWHYPGIEIEVVSNEETGGYGSGLMEVNRVDDVDKLKEKKKK
ncbi:DNRLRE domain-containing protein [Mechercharimyces sp. CAU 1602]|uniref:DNRLRE domain-containing protein n=1 Tax=Mechercharimyces sp. CAU 1602 TaxID=2973933 RepID=UPI002162308A|nr:DNRLRE domain-containing protein [Mechercharimyces sp. CAU 1602]MCS1351879.1 DNRLRE domain-containing protein [Mechercharimyces sp. CAU 1602]